MPWSEEPFAGCASLAAGNFPCSLELPIDENRLCDPCAEHVVQMLEEAQFPFDGLPSSMAIVRRHEMGPDPMTPMDERPTYLAVRGTLSPEARRERDRKRKLAKQAKRRNRR